MAFVGPEGTCHSFVVVAAEGIREGAGNLLRLLQRQYDEESFGARPERSR